MNERLRVAMVQAHTDIAAVADAACVDPKTVQRWLAGRVPHPRHRWAVADLVREDEGYIWPDTDDVRPGPKVATAEVINVYARRADAPIDLWWSLFTQAEHHIDLLGYAIIFLHEQHPGLCTLLKQKAGSGGQVRIVVAHPTARQLVERDAEERVDGGVVARVRTSLVYFRQIAGIPGIEIRGQHVPMYNSVFRFDNQMLVTPHLYRTPGFHAPLLHLRRLGPDGVFETFLGHFEGIWSEATPMMLRSLAEDEVAR